MNQYDRFIFESFKLDPATHRLELNYSLDEKIHFQEVITFPETFALPAELSPDLERALFAVHLSGGTSYYKTYCPKTIEIRSGALTSEQAEFWNTLYTKGLGEFFFVNKMDFHGLINFPSSAAETPAIEDNEPTMNTPLVPFGGGKDSIVTSELLRAHGANQTLFRVNHHKITSEIAEIAGLPILSVQRSISPTLFELQAKDALKGHVPITAHITFIGLVVALLGGHDSVVFSNERSANFGNIDYLGMTINHQWSKSFEAELMLRHYIETFVTKRVGYFNALRPLSELHIVKLFAKHPKYFEHATSCNKNWKILDADPNQPRWCGHCPKCAFVFALLAAVLPPAQVFQIFGKNLFEEPALHHTYLELMDIEGMKPFECVGTPDETKAAFYLAGKHTEYDNSPIMQVFKQQVLPNLAEPDKLVESLLTPEFTDTPPQVVQLLKEGI